MPHRALILIKANLCPLVGELRHEMQQAAQQTARSKGVEMFKLWKASTIAAIAVAIAAAAAYAAGGDIAGPMVAGLFAALIVFFVAFATTDYVTTTGTAVTAASSLAIFLVFRQTTMIYGALPTWLLLTPILVIGVLGTLVLSVVNAKDDGAAESYLELAVAVLPFGVGTVLGGLILVVRRIGGGHHVRSAAG